MSHILYQDRLDYFYNNRKKTVDIYDVSGSCNSNGFIQGDMNCSMPLEKFHFARSRRRAFWSMGFILDDLDFKCFIFFLYILI